MLRLPTEHAYCLCSIHINILKYIPRVFCSTSGLHFPIALCLYCFWKNIQNCASLKFYLYFIFVAALVLGKIYWGSVSIERVLYTVIECSYVFLQKKFWFQLLLMFFEITGAVYKLSSEWVNGLTKFTLITT